MEKEMKTIWKLSNLTIFILCFFVVGAAALQAQTTELYVDDSFGTVTPPQFKTIQEAVTYAQDITIIPASTTVIINIAAGTYDEEVHIDRGNLKFIGPNAAINPNTAARVAEAVIAPPSGSAGLKFGWFSAGLTYENIEVKGLKFDSFSNNSAIIFGKASGAPFIFNTVMVQNNIFSNLHLEGIRIHSSGTGYTIDQNRFEGWTETVYVVPYGSFGIHVFHNNLLSISSLNITNNHFLNPDDIFNTKGMYIRYTVNNLLIDGNTIGDSNNGITIGIHVIGTGPGTNDTVISNNTIKKADTGIRARGFAAGELEGIEIKNNTLEDCNSGLLLVHTLNSVIKGNTITGSTANGINLSSNKNLSIIENILQNNLRGIYLIFDQDSTTAHWNLIEGNTLGVYAGSGTTGSVDLKYNYWGDPTGPSGSGPYGLGTGTGDPLRDESSPSVISSFDAWLPEFGAGVVSVTIDPAAARTAGAQWSIDGGTAWHNSGDEVGAAVTATLLVSMSDIHHSAPWAAPSASTFVPVIKSEITTESVSYSQINESPSLNVILNNGGSSASFDIDGPVGFTDVDDSTSSYDKAAVPAGDYQVVFSDEVGYYRTISTSATILGPFGTIIRFPETNPTSTTVGHGEEHVVTATYTIKKYSVTVNSATGGSTDKDGTTNNVEHGTVMTITANPEAGYSFKHWSGGSTSSDNPLNLEVTGDTEITPVFERDTGTLNVNLSDGGSGATFDVKGPVDFNGGSDLTGQTSNLSQAVPTGDYTVTFADPANYTRTVSASTSGATTFSESNPSTGTVNKNETHTVNGDYTIFNYNVQVNSASGGTTDRDGANSVDHGSDIVITATPDSGYSFKVWTEDNTSSDNPLTLSNVTDDFNITPEFERNTARLIVKLDQAATNGSFSISGPSDFSAVSNRTTNYDEIVPTGDYTVTFSAVANYDASVAATTFTVGSNSAGGTLVKDTTETVEGTYSQLFGSLTVIIDPPEAANAGAQWQVDSGSAAPSRVRPAATLYNSGQTIILSAGNHTVSFSSIPGWDTPASQSATISSGAVTILDLSNGIAYQQHTGSLRVSIVSSEAVAAGAAWRLQGANGWRNAGTTASGIPIGSHRVEFKSVNGWITPDTIPVTIFRDQTRSVTGIYAEGAASGNLQVFISDGTSGDMTESGAQWRPLFPGSAPASDIWYESGDIITSLPEGTVSLEFSVVTGYLLPSLTSVEIKQGKNKFTGEYLKPLIVHRSDYDGDGTEDLAIHDAATRTWLIASSGNNKTSTAAKLLFKKKFGTKVSIPTPGDYDGDGVADLAYYLDTKGEWKVSKQFKLKDFGQTGDIPVPGDYNGNGRTDPALYRPSTGEWLIHDRDRDKTMTVSFGSATEIPVPGNYDGDAAGMTDLAVYDVVTGKWRVAIYNARKNKWVSKKKLGATFGAVGEMPVQADYDGDGKTDIAVYNRELSLWKVMGQFELELGIEGDVPVPNDWAGLGRAIPAIFRAKTGAWIALDDLLKARFGAGGQPLVSGR